MHWERFCIQRHRKKMCIHLPLNGKHWKLPGESSRFYRTEMIFTLRNNKITTAYTRGKIFTGKNIEANKAILVNEGVIVDIVNEKEIPSQYSNEDLGGNTIAPAFIDMQIYGGNGKMFSHELSVESLQATYEYCLSG